MTSYINILCEKGTQTIMFVQLRYGIKYFNSRELSFGDQTFPLVLLDVIILKIFILYRKKLFLSTCEQSSFRSSDNLGDSYTSNKPIPV